MLERVLIAGSGGQGIVLAGRLLAVAAVHKTEHVTFFPSYGAEVRGGTSNCQIILSSSEISSPLAEQFDSMLIMNQDSLDYYGEAVKKSPFVLLNSSLCRRPAGAGKILEVPASGLAGKLGDIRVSNFIMIGAYLARKPVVVPEDFENAIRDSLARKGENILDLNLRAFRIGLGT